MIGYCFWFTCHIPGLWDADLLCNKILYYFDCDQGDED